MPIGGDHAVLTCWERVVDLAWSCFERDLIGLRNDVGLIERQGNPVERERCFVPGCHIDSDDVLLKNLCPGCGDEALDASAVEFGGVGGSELSNHDNAHRSDHEQRGVGEKAGLETTG